MWMCMCVMFISKDEKPTQNFEYKKTEILHICSYVKYGQMTMQHPTQLTINDKSIDRKNCCFQRFSISLFSLYYDSYTMQSVFQQIIM